MKRNTRVNKTQIREERLQAIAQSILSAFESGAAVKAAAYVFLNGTSRNCSSWSVFNRWSVAMSGESDAATYKGWQTLGRQVRKGEKAKIMVLEPIIVKREDDNGEVTSHFVGSKVGVRFGLSQTDPIPGMEDLYSPDETEIKHIDSLPLIEVAHAWNINVTTYNAKNSGALGWYQSATNTIAVGVENPTVWLHELVHAADDQNGTLKERGVHRELSEAVAEFGCAVLCSVLGVEHPDNGQHYISHYAGKVELSAADLARKVLDRALAAVQLILDAANE